MAITHKQLAHALALADHGNFTQAAEESNLSQPAFSRSIKNLEEGSAAWDIEYERVLERVKRTKGLEEDD